MTFTLRLNNKKITCFLYVKRSRLRGVINYKLQIYSNQIVNCWSRDIFYEAYFTKFALWSMFRKLFWDFFIFSRLRWWFLWYFCFVAVFSASHLCIAKNELFKKEHRARDNDHRQAHGLNAKAKPNKEATEKPVLGCQVGFSLSHCTFSSRLLKRRFWIHEHGQVLGELWKFP